MGLTQLNFGGEDKITTAIERLKSHEPPEGYFLAFSGGKDSICIYNLAIAAGVKFDAHYSVSPIDPPELHQFIKENYPDVIWDYTAKGFFRMVAKNGLPSRMRRWCCVYIKEGNGKDRIRMMGIRWEESPGRRKNYKTVSSIGRLGDTQICPILDWNEAEVWEYIESNGLAFPSLYDEGYARIGCVMCPQQSKKKMRLDIERWPKIAWCWWRATERYYEGYHVRNPDSYYQSAADMWLWWTGSEPPQPAASAKRDYEGDIAPRTLQDGKDLI